MPKKKIWTYEDRALLVRLLKATTEPARRHRCEICDVIFECHLCGIEDEATHPLHHAGRKRDVLICESCIEVHQLWVVATNVQIRGQRSPKRPWRDLGKQQLFYDHLTGACLGRGSMRQY